jgi:membrane-associated HD superfamily phosphohydrolase
VSSGFTDTYKEGEVLNKTVVVPADITTIDAAETERRRQVAREETKGVFNFDSSRAETSVQSFRAAWEDLKKQEATHPSKVWTAVTDERHIDSAILIWIRSPRSFER